MPDSVRRASVKVPLRVVTGEAYSDLAFVFAAKVGHLAAGPNQPGCIADLTTIARYLGLTVRSVTQPDGRVALKAPSSLYAAQKQLTAGEELTVVRRTKPSGTGTSAVRRLRTPEKGEPWVMVPVALLGAVPHRHARAYAVICYARARGHHLTYAELADVLRHQSGRRIGEPVSVRAARGVVSDLERWGWVEVGRREGWQGRNMLVPLRPFENPSDHEPAAAAGADTEAAESVDIFDAEFPGGFEDPGGHGLDEGHHEAAARDAESGTEEEASVGTEVGAGETHHVTREETTGRAADRTTDGACVVTCDRASAHAGERADNEVPETTRAVVAGESGVTSATPAEAVSNTGLEGSSEPARNGVSAGRSLGAEGQWTSGPQGVGTSVTYKEDTPIDLQVNADFQGGSARRASYVVDGHEHAKSPQTASTATPAQGTPAAEPRRIRPVPTPDHRTTISATAARAFVGIAPLVARMSTGQRVVAARLVDRAVAEVGDADRVFARLADRWRTQDEAVRSPVGWLGGRGLARRGCEDPNCEDGRLWLPTAAPGAGVAGDPFACRNCARQDQDRRAEADERFGAERRAAHRARQTSSSVAAVAEVRPTVAPAPIGTCEDCDRAVRGLREDGVCADCREDRESAAAAGASRTLQAAF
ncbi:hypothetical protein [Embleya scabrispora]|uniref:hypothetical protein n=1 Tax=Embleya scabrispora TaxID=159449 RepID=UPI001319F910|nr:hypothetical protein [Embleya scabrispora]MYS87433.1 hypothetical protein [Streptomyces sp. SID5474]